MKRFTTVFLLLLSLLASSDVAFSDPTELLDVFSTEVDTGEGTLIQSTVGEPKEEKFALGKEEGRYGLGMVMPNNILDKKTQNNFKDLDILQLAFGNLKTKTEAGLVPQFGTASLFFNKLPTSTTSLEIIHSPAKQQNWNRSALVWYTSPETLAALGDEEKLKNTYFGTFGKITMTPVDMGKEVAVTANGGRLNFLRYVYQMDLDITLSTPFSTTKRKLTGSVRIPVFSPKGKPAEDFSRKIASAKPEGIETFIPEKKAKPKSEKKNKSKKSQ